MARKKKSDDPERLLSDSEHALATALKEALESLGVSSANKAGRLCHWSYLDLSLKLAPILLESLSEQGVIDVSRSK